ncbi:MAG: hypothetical protein IJJ86_05955 [Clostridia bacterium]|nr:hypothetical protein [Clostridia bacterium]
MQKLRLLCALLAALLLFCGCGNAANEPDEPKTEPPAAIGADDVVLTVGDTPVYAVVYRYYLNDRLRTIRENGLDERETYLKFVSGLNTAYGYGYYDTRTEAGMDALCADVLNELAVEAAAYDLGVKRGDPLTAQEQAYLHNAAEDAEEKLSDLLQENGGTYESREAFFKETGFTEERYAEMFERSLLASMYFSHILEDYTATHSLTDAELLEGYARIVKETFADRYIEGAYSAYLYYYVRGQRSFPSLYVPDDAIFVRVFAHTEPTDEQREAFKAQAEADFDALYESADNEFSVQKVGDLAVAPNDSLIDGLYEAAKDVPEGSVGTLTTEQDGKTTVYFFLRIAGETGVVPIDRYPGVRERIERQLIGKNCMDELRAMGDDPSVTVRNEELIRKCRPEQ